MTWDELQETSQRGKFSVYKCLPAGITIRSGRTGGVSVAIDGGEPLHLCTPREGAECFESCFKREDALALRDALLELFPLVDGPCSTS